MNNKTISALCAIFMILAPVSGLSVSATEEEIFCTENSEEEIVTSVGLIIYKYLSISKSGTTLYVTTETRSDSTMKSIGFKNIVVEYSTNKSDWNTYTTIGDILNSSANSCYMTNYSVPITNGYYYRVTLNHYAKATGWFGASQSEPNTSNVVS